MNDLDRVLTSELELVPASGFAASVMSTIREEVERPPIPFPWGRFAASLVVSIVTALAALVWIARQPSGSIGVGDLSLASPTGLLAVAAGALLGTFALLRATRVLLRG